MDFLKATDPENENDSPKSSLAINGNSLCFDPTFVQSLCKVFPINLIKTVRYSFGYMRNTFNVCKQYISLILPSHHL